MGSGPAKTSTPLSQPSSTLAARDRQVSPVRKSSETRRIPVATSPPPLPARDADSMRRIQALQGLEEQRRMEAMEVRIRQLEAQPEAAAPHPLLGISLNAKPAATATPTPTPTATATATPTATPETKPRSMDEGSAFTILHQEIADLRSTFQQELKALRTETENSKKRDTECKEEREKLGEEVAALKGENEALKTVVGEMQVQVTAGLELAVQCKAMTQDIASIKEFNNQFEENFVNVTQETTVRITGLEELRGVAEEAVNKVKECLDDSAARTIQHDALQEQCRDLHTEHTELATSHENLHQQCRDLHTEHTELATQHENLHQQCADLHTEHTMLTSQHDALKQGTDSLMEQCRDLHTSSMKVEATIEVISSKVNATDARTNDLQEGLQSINTACKLLNQKETDMAMNIQNIEQKTTTIEQQTANLEQHATNLETQHHGLVEQCRTLHSEHSELQNDHETLREQCSTLHTEHTELQTHHETLMEQCRELHTLSLALREDVDKAGSISVDVATLKTHLSQTTEDTMALKAKLSSMEDAVKKQLQDLAEVLQRDGPGLVVQLRHDIEGKLLEVSRKNDSLSMQLDASLTGLSATNTAMQRLNERLTYMDEAMESAKDRSAMHSAQKTPMRIMGGAGGAGHPRSISPTRHGGTAGAMLARDARDTGHGESNRVRELERRLGLPAR